MDKILRVALDTRGGKFEPGTILGTYPDTVGQRSVFGTCELCAFLLVRATSSILTEQEFLDQCRELQWRLDLDTVLTAEELSAYVANLTNIHDAHLTGQLQDYEAEYAQNGTPPDWDRVVDLDAAGILVRTKGTVPRKMVDVVDPHQAMIDLYGTE